MKMKTKVSPEIAQSEINQWLDAKHISEKKRSSFETQIELLANAIEEGNLIRREEDNVLIQKLLFPIGEETPIAELHHKPRIKVSNVQARLKGVKNDDPDGRITAYISAITEQPVGVVRSMDTEDYGLSQSIAVFFL